jgi:hypothetical protein
MHMGKLTGAGYRPEPRVRPSTERTSRAYILKWMFPKTCSILPLVEFFSFSEKSHFWRHIKLYSTRKERHQQLERPTTRQQQTTIEPTGNAANQIHAA